MSNVRIGKWERHTGRLKSRLIEARDQGFTATEWTDGREYWACAFGTTSERFRFSYQAHTWIADRYHRENAH